MSGSRVFFLVFYILVALVGLLQAGTARDDGITIFGLGLLIFGVFRAFSSIKLHFDEIEQSH
jgi:hypothetical protein